MTFFRTDKTAWYLVVLIMPLAFLVSFVLPKGAVAQKTPSQRKHILLINSYHHNFIWNKEISQGLTEVLRPEETDIIFHIEDMDTLRLGVHEQYLKQLKGVIENKYDPIELDLIMTTDNDAFHFISRFHDELFPKVPVVFCGLDNYHRDLLLGHPLFTGVAEKTDPQGTLWWALTLNPKTKTVFVITDQTQTGKIQKRTLRNELSGFSPKVDIIFSAATDIKGILQRINSLPKNSIILFTDYFRDGHGQFYAHGEALNLIAQETKLPIYGLMNFDLGKGIVGGMLISGYQQGQAMAQIALHVLSGRFPHDIPVIENNVSRPRFDYNELTKHSLNINALPNDCDIINRPTSFYNENIGLIWAGATFTSIQMVIILFLVVNTSRRRQAEKELRYAHQLLEERVRERTSEVKESVDALQTVFDASHDGICIHDANGRILEVNERMLKMYKISRHDFRDFSLTRDLSSRANAVHRLSATWRLVINGEPQFFEWRARRPYDASEFDVEVYLNRIVFHGQEAILSNIRDITVRKESENRIRQSLSKFEAILENSLVGIAMSQGSKLQTINRRGAEIFGYSPGEIIGHEFSLLMDSKETVLDFAEASRKALLNKGEYYTEQAFQDKNKNLVWCRMYAKTVDPNSLDKGVIWAWDDVTEQRESQNELMRAREDAEAANRAKSEFLAAMSHEIRTPMNAIVGMTEITLQTDLDANQRDYLQTVMDSANHLLSILNDILDLSKIEARKFTLDRSDFDLPFHIQTTIKGLEVQGVQKGLKMSLDIDEAVPLCVKGDPLAFRQILVNLVGNAIKFTHKGEVNVRVTTLPAQTPPPNQAQNIGLSIHVQDTGIGIPKEFVGSIFQNFSQSSRAFGGTGLGLAICKRLIALMHGEIDVASHAGQGSTFSFTAWFEPGTTCAAIVEPRDCIAEAPTRPIRILVAEDNDVNVMVTTLRLEDMGYSFSVAANGLEVLDLLKREPFDLILMDIEMPTLDGISATKSIRAAREGGPIPNPSIPIIGVTAHALKEFRIKCIDAGMDDYVSKPVDFHALAVIINRLVGENPALPTQGKRQQDQPTNNNSKRIKKETCTPHQWSSEKVQHSLDLEPSSLEGFLETAQTELIAMQKELHEAVKEHDIDNILYLTSTISSLASTIEAPTLAQISQNLRSLCQDKKEMTNTLKSLDTTIDQMVTLMSTESHHNP